MSDDLISRLTALEHLRKRLIQTANNNVGFVCDAGATFEDASERVKTWLDEVPSIDAVPQWTPCNEMLPDGRLNKSYLVQDKDGRLAVGTYTNWGWMFGHYMNDPVAWMPLPKPYERKEE